MLGQHAMSVGPKWVGQRGAQSGWAHVGPTWALVGPMRGPCCYPPLVGLLVYRVGATLETESWPEQNISILIQQFTDTELLYTVLQLLTLLVASTFHEAMPW